MPKCQYCGNNVSENDKFCTFCGAEQQRGASLIKSQSDSFNSSFSSQNDTSNELELYKLAQKNQEYYKEAFERIENNKFKLNWVAFFFFPFWAVYRKMYAVTAIFIVLYTALSWLFSYIEFLDFIFPFAVAVLLAIFANKIYRNHLIKIVEEANNQDFLTSEQRNTYLLQKTGTSVAAHIILIAIYVAFFILIFILAFIFALSAYFLFY